MTLIGPLGGVLSPLGVAEGQSPLLAGLSLRLTMDAADISGSTMACYGSAGLSATLNGSPSSVSGKRNEALSFASASSQHVNIASSNSLITGATKLSICGWFKRTSAGGLACLTCRTGATDGVFVGFFTDGKCYVLARNSDASNANVSSNDTNWHHVAMVFDGSQTGNSNRLKLYLDGALQSPAFGGTVPASTSTTGSILVGRDLGGGGYANGSADDVMVFSGVAKSATDISNIYNSY